MSASAIRASRAPLYATVAAVVLLTAAVLGFARFGDPAVMPAALRKLAETNWVHNPRAFQDTFTPSWGRLCRAWDSWLGDVQNNAPRLLANEALWTGPDDPVRVALVEFSRYEKSMLPAALVPASAAEKRLSVLAESPSEAVRKELLRSRTADAVDRAYARAIVLAAQLKRWPHVQQELPGFSKALAAVAR